LSTPWRDVAMMVRKGGDYCERLSELLIWLFVLHVWDCTCKNPTINIPDPRRHNQTRSGRLLDWTRSLLQLERANPAGGWSGRCLSFRH
jgi:hypothetical protein